MLLSESLEENLINHHFTRFGLSRGCWAVARSLHYVFKWANQFLSYLALPESAWGIGSVAILPATFDTKSNGMDGDHVNVRLGFGII